MADRLERAQQRADEATRMLNSEMFQLAFSDTRQAMINAWLALDVTDDRYPVVSTELHRRIKSLELVKACIERHIDSGKIADIEVQGREKRTSFFSRKFIRDPA